MISNVSMPCSRALRPASSAATCAAYGVDLRLPLKPWLPEDDQACVTLYAEASDNAAAERLLDHWQNVVETAP